MIDGTYSIEVDSTLGRKRGTVSIHTEGDRAIADIDAPVIGKRRVEGRAEGDAFAASGTLKLKLMGEIAYTLQGRVVGDDLHITIDSDKGRFDLSGTRV